MGHKEHIVHNACDKFPYKLNSIDHQCWGVLYWAQMINRPCKFKLPEGKTFLWCIRTHLETILYALKTLFWSTKRKSTLLCFLGTDEDIQEPDIVSHKHPSSVNFRHYVHFTKGKQFSCLFSSSRSLWKEYYYIQEEAWNQKTNKFNLINCWN